MKAYNHIEIEEKWLAAWEKQRLFLGTQNQTTREKLYLLFAFAYPSGSGLHVGHVESKTALDILARYYRMNGKQVFFPVGWDAFGLPAENYAVKTGTPPAVTTKNAINTFRRQIKRLGISYDWDNEIATNHPEYYKWTQWLFLQLYSKGLAYKGKGMVNWCPSCQTVLANEQVVEGACERCGSEVTQKDLEQWYFKITDYKDELISGLDQVDWPHATKQQQLNWIGKKQGARVVFFLRNSHFQKDYEVFTTRVDTIFGVTFMVIAPELAEQWISEGWQADEQVKAYIQTSKRKTEEERQIGEKKKTGVKTDLMATNPVNGNEVPVFVADYVLAGYGTGMIMGVPAHDERDGAFAAAFDLPVIEVVGGDGLLVNSGEFAGIHYAEALEKIPTKFPDVMKKATTYKLRDWLISRQRYWGAPIPIVYDPEGVAHPVKEEHLPWTLPTDVEFKPTGESPLTYSKEFKERVEKLYGKGWWPEYDTMDTFVDSSWYYLRYVDSRNKEAFATKEQLEKWLPVDFYMIGPEHIVLHLLYSRFLTKFLRDQGYLSFDEPFMKMRHQGMILGPDHKKMSKSKGNVIDPDAVIAQYGADTLRVYEMFMGPIEADKPWSTTSVVGVARFLKRMYGFITEDSGDTSKELAVKLHQTLKKVSEDIPALKFNTAIAALMELANAWEGKTMSSKDKRLVVGMLAPFAPFMAEELHALLGNTNSIHLTEWPVFDSQQAAAGETVIAVQVNGKLRATLLVNSGSQALDNAVVEKMARNDEKTAKWLVGKTVRKVVFVPPRENGQGLINFVVS